ncbi:MULTISPECIES: TAXI family TRAP transporter solute-binding subunit [Cytobacillus]|uniref:TAXI family TRAP transporter solute-binding subunit n=1 Tax=Cytobacillus TaxID=2675230 RepID=UPI00135B9CFC|nr:TAXI family TRAP transporter solute-binding subunit [Cytobacillus sp. AMY 15.2]KAF0815534.1 TRAP transporter solute receptor, TAXI family precursor [Bacillus sp. ZZV12-4809]MCM3094217.1 TAXI family TRAP transporter solute-binding subunit [Cytobacillus sp. AMY 15.2]
MKSTLSKLFIIVAALTLALVGCSQSSTSKTNDSGSTDKEKAEEHRLLLGTSSQGGTYYVWGGGWADIIGKNVPGTDIAVEVTGGPNANIQLIENGEMDLGFVTAWLGGEAYNGEGWADKKYTKIRSIFPMYASVMHMYSLKDSGITSISDFDGKNVSTGAPGSTSAEAGNGLLEVLGSEPARVNAIPTNTAVDGLRDGTIDAGFAVTGVPGPFMLDLETTHEVQQIGLTEDEMKKALEKYPYWSEATIPNGSYKHQEEDILLPGFWNIAIASSELSEDLVYNLVKTTFEKHEDLLAVDPSAKETLVENVKYSTVPYHPGAVKYYKEVGVEIPDHLMPPESK